MHHTIKNDDIEIPFSFGMDYVTSKKNGQIYCVDVNVGHGDVVVGDGGYFAIESHPIIAKVKRALFLTNTPKCPKYIFDMIFAKSDHLEFIPEEHRPKTSLIPIEDVHQVAKSFIYNNDTDTSFRKGIEPFLGSNKMIVKTDNTYGGKGVTLVNPNEAEHNPIHILESLSKEFPQRIMNILDTPPFLLYVIAYFSILYSFDFNFQKDSWWSLFNGILLGCGMGLAIGHGLAALDIKKEKNYVFQEYIPPTPADMGPDNKTSCLRHLIHGSYNIETREIVTTLDLFSQRLGEVVDPEGALGGRTGIIGYSQGSAESVHASEEEKKTAIDITHQIIHNIFTNAYPQKEEQ